MKLLRSIPKLPAVFAAGSFLLLLLLMALTSPVKAIGWTIIFFILVVVFLVSLGFLAVGYKKAPSRQASQQIVSLSFLVVLLIMFRSAQSLSWADFGVLVLTTFALLFYLRRR